MTKKQKKQLVKIIISAALFVCAFFAGRLTPFVSAVAYLICGYDVVVRAIKNIVRLKPFDEHFLMTVASVGAFLIGEPKEGAAVMLFYQVGELFQSIAVGKSRKAIAALSDIAPEFACIVRDGENITVSPEEVRIGDTILIKPGERVPVDCTIEEGMSDVDMSAITGESLPYALEPGERIPSGSINISGVIYAKAEATYENSTVAKILDLTENVSERKSTYESFIHRFAKWYTPAVVIGAIVLAVVPGVISGNYSEWIKRALTFLVISCPCALVISVPLSFFAGLGRASARGILIKGTNFLEALATAQTAVFDKTGTLTTGKFYVDEVIPCGVTKEELLRFAASAECFSNHPLAQAITKEYTGEKVPCTNVREIPGAGISADTPEGTLLVGNSRLMSQFGVACKSALSDNTQVYVARNGKFLGQILISDKVKENAKEAILKLKNCGIKKNIILTGDKKDVAEKVCRQVGADRVYADLLPDGKVMIVEEIMKKSREALIYCGDGINDAPVMALADVSVSMGQIGQSAAIEASDIVICDDNLEQLPRAIKIARKTVGIARANIIFSIGVKVLVLISGALGVTNIWAAVFADVGVCALAVLNSMRLLSEKFIKD